MLNGLRGEDRIAERCRNKGIARSLCYKWFKDFMEAGKKRLAGDIVRQANTSEVAEVNRETRDLKKVVAEQTLELRYFAVLAADEEMLNALYLSPFLMDMNCSRH